jgi:hypothetical protein
VLDPPSVSDDPPGWSSAGSTMASPTYVSMVELVLDPPGPSWDAAVIGLGIFLRGLEVIANPFLLAALSTRPVGWHESRNSRLNVNRGNDEDAEGR